MVLAQGQPRRQLVLLRDLRLLGSAQRAKPGRGRPEPAPQVQRPAPAERLRKRASPVLQLAAQADRCAAQAMGRRRLPLVQLALALPSPWVLPPERTSLRPTRLS
jgi:hypothetical protein